METTNLNEMAALAADYVNTTSQHIFLTGKAGTGKTTFLKHIVQHTFKYTIVAAPTGIAAINAGGVTLHSLLHLPFGAFVPENIPFHEGVSTRINTPRSLNNTQKFREEKLQLIRQMELLIIDEVSMLRADLLDAIGHRLRSIRKRREPFGGVQLLFIGDLMQLPPVVKEDEWNWLRSYYKSPYFFEARALIQHPPRTIELQHIYRQSDQIFIDILNRLRNNDQTHEDLVNLNQYYKPEVDHKGSIYLTTHNYKADRINKRELDALDSPEFTYKAAIQGDFPEHIYPNPPNLCLKKGAQIMFIKNDPTGKGLFFNGKIATISELTKDSIWAEFEEGGEVEIEAYEWENIRFSVNKVTQQIEPQKLGSFWQFPIKLAWAVTVHKSQGLTFDKAILDVSDSFAPGQLYVALSRLTSLRGLQLASLLPTHPPEIDQALLQFVADFEDEESLKARLENDQKGFLEDYARVAFQFSYLLQLLDEHLATFNKQENRSTKQQFQAWTQEIYDQFSPLPLTGQKFTQQVFRLLRQSPNLAPLVERCQKAQEYFEPIFLHIIHQIQDHLQKLEETPQIKAYRKELRQIENRFIFQIRQLVRFCLMVEALSGSSLPDKELMVQWEMKNRLKLSPTKGKKKATALITYELFEEGNTIEEIAKIRTLTVDTIQKHLCRYLENGEIEVERMMSIDKVVHILEVAEELEFERVSELKGVLGDGFSYGEIRIALAYKKGIEA